jgi:pyrimidine deaminase RibD-like protein
MAALLVAQDGTVLADGFSDYNTHAIIAVFEHAGLNIHVHDSEWIVSSPTAELTATIAGATLYLTLEPTTEARGVKTPPLTSLIIQTGIHRAVIGSPHPVLDLQATGAVALYSAGIQVSLGKIMKDECDFLIREYTELANSKLQRMARKHFELFGRPLGLLHCSVVDSDNVEAFARQGNAFGTAFSGGTLSYRNFGTYQLAPPPDIIWKDNGEYDEDDVASMISVDFEEENYQGEMTGSPLMPWYGQVDAVVVTFPREENGPPDDKSITGRLRGLKWLATHGCSLPVGVERIVVLDASDLKDLPVTNDDPNLPPGLDIEKFWAAAQWRKATRIILRRAGNASAQAAARAAAKAAQKAAEAAALAASAVEVGDAARAAEIAMEYKKAAQAAADLVQKELEASTRLKQKFEKQGVIIESIDGGEPIDIMKHLGTTDGLHSVVWRAGCWGERGVRAVLAGAFQWVSAHMAVEAMGGKFWQLMLAENAVQAAVGPRSKVKVFADQEDISLEYCDQPDADKDCVLSIAGRPVRLVRLDCRVALVDDSRPREFSIAKTRKMDRKTLTEEAPWFL